MPNNPPTGKREQQQRDQPHIFVVNGEPEFLNMMRDVLQGEKYNVTTTNFVPATFEQVVSAQPNVLIIDLVIGQRAGWNLLEAVHAEAATARIPVIIVSTTPHLIQRAQAMAERYPTFGTLEKPFNIEDLTALIDAALEENS